jgi:hypothetical protein
MPARATEPLRSWVWYRAKIASTLAADPAADVTELRRSYNEAYAAAKIRLLLARPPAPTAEGRARLAAIITEPRRRRAS